jgi:DinB family protein
MQRLILVLSTVALTLPAVSGAQDQPLGPLAAALKTTLTRYTTNMPGAAELMPADKYGFKPTPEQLSFGEILAHEAGSNELLCGAIAGGPPAATPAGAGPAAPKDSLVARLKKSFEYCGSVIAQLKENALGDSVSVSATRKMTRARAIIVLAQDWADHYAQAAMYLRANGILPPSARPRQ